MDPALLRLLSSIALVEVIQADDAFVLASVHPGLAPEGGLSAPWGDPDGAGAAIAAGEAWLRAQGCTSAIGPVEVCTWFTYRANLGPHDFPVFPKEPRADPEPWRVAGYTALERYSSVLVPHAPQFARFRGAEARAAQRGFSFRPLDPARFEDDLRAAWSLSMGVFRAFFRYVDLPWEVFRVLYEPIRRLDPRLVCLVEHDTGAVVGFTLNLPGPSTAVGPVAVYKTLAVHPSLHGVGLGSALQERAHRIAQDLGFNGGMIHALMGEGATSQFLHTPGSARIRDYAVFGRSLTGAAGRG